MFKEIHDLESLLDIADQLVREREWSQAVVLCNSVLNDLRNLEGKGSTSGAVAGAAGGALTGAFLIPGFFWLTSAIGGYVGKKIVEKSLANSIEALRARAYGTKAKVAPYAL